MRAAAVSVAAPATFSNGPTGMFGRRHDRRAEMDTGSGRARTVLPQCHGAICTRELQRPHEGNSAQ